MRIAWEVTQFCNLRCKHCYTLDSLTSKDTGLPFKEKKLILDRMAQDYPGATLHLLGGEPLLSSDFCEIVEYANALGLAIDVTTNGTIAGLRICEAISRYVDHLFVSVDAPVSSANDFIRGTGSLQRACQFIERINNVRRGTTPKIFVAHTLTSRSLPYAKQLIEFCVSRSLNGLVVNIAKPIGGMLSYPELLVSPIEQISFIEDVAYHSTGENIEVMVLGGSFRLKEYIRWKYANDIVKVSSACGAGVDQLMVSKDGHLTACYVDQTPQANSAENYSVIEIKKQGRVLRETMRAPSSLPCNTCVYRDQAQCYGGCSHLGFHVPAQLCVALLSKGIY
ncbi:radical SAM protein [Burkholderia sp. AW33-5]